MELTTLGFGAGAAGWQAGHQAVHGGALVLAREYPPFVELDPWPELEPELEEFAARAARAYMRDVVERAGLTPAQGVRIFGVCVYTFINGALDEAAQRRGR